MSAPPLGATPLTTLHSETTPATDPTPLAVDARELARLLGLSLRTIRAMDGTGKLPRGLTFGQRAKRWALDGPNGIRAWLAAGAPDRRTWEKMQDA